VYIRILFMDKLGVKILNSPIFGWLPVTVVRAHDINHFSQNCLMEFGSLPVNASTPVAVMSSVCSNCALL